MFEVGVVGVGSMGSMVLWQLARRGIAAIGFEQFTVGHDRGAATGDTRIFRTLYKRNPAYIPLLLESRRRWRELEADTGMDHLQLTGVASIGALDHWQIRAQIGCMEEFGLEADVLDHQDANARYPTINVLPGEIAVVDRGGGLMKPERAVVAAAAHAEANGAVIARRSKVLAIEPDPGGVWVRTDERDVRVRRLVLTTGAWAGQLLDRVRPGLVTPHRLVHSWFLARRPELFHPSVFPIVNRVSNGSDFSVHSSQDGNTVKAGLNVNLGPIDSPDSLAREVQPSEVARIASIVRELYPDLWPEPVRLSAHTDGFTPDQDAVIGALPDMPSVVVAVGFSAHGFKMCPAIGSALADLATTGTTETPVHFLHPGREVHAAPEPHPAARVKVRQVAAGST